MLRHLMRTLVSVCISVTCCGGCGEPGCGPVVTVPTRSGPTPVDVSARTLNVYVVRSSSPATVSCVSSIFCLTCFWNGREPGAL